MQGVWLLLLHLKGCAIMVLILSQFQRVDPDRIILWVMEISLLFTLNNLVAFTLRMLAGSAVAQGLSESHYTTWLQVDCGLCLAGVAAYFDAPALAPVCQHAQALRHVSPHRQS